MAHRKEEYDAAGHTVTIQQVNEGGHIGAWIDGYAAHEEAAMDSLVNDSETADMDIAEKVAYHRENGEMWDAIETLLSFMIDCDVYYCKECGTFYDYTKARAVSYAGHICADCKAERNACPDSPDGKHHDKCLNPRQKRNASMPTKYKCEHCGRTRKTITTG